jgi:pimeloyl-ACP methyl ester carboxylesterase
MPEIVNDGVRVQYDVIGAGRPVILLGGWGCDRTWWEHAGFLERLAPDFRLLNVDLRGHGGSDKPHDPAAYRAERVIEDVLAVADAEGADRFAIWGLSYGGWYGWMAADSRPDRVVALVSSGNWNPVPETEESWREFGKVYVDTLQRNGTRGVIDLYRQEDAESYDREYPPWAEAVTLRADPLALAALQDRSLIEQTISSPMEEFPVPVLLTAGELEDEDDLAGRNAARLPRGQSLRLPGLGHGGACAASDQLVPVAREFLDRWL